jgi:hypothetical protein
LGHALLMPEILRVLDRVDLLLAELVELRSRGPHFRIRHRFWMNLDECLPGEEILSVSLVHRDREYWLPLSLPLRILFDYLARHSRFPQSAAQIETGIREDPFSIQHASNVAARSRFTRGIPRSHVRVYVERLRIAFQQSFREADLPREPREVLLSEKTVMNEIGYRLVASVDWVHTKPQKLRFRSSIGDCPLSGP